MWHDGELDKYKEYDVPRDTEIIWIVEYRNGLLDQLKVETSNNKIDLLFRSITDLILQYSPKPELFLTLIEFIEKRKDRLDSFTLLLLAENLLRHIEEYNKSSTSDSALSTRVKEYALGILRELLEKPITVDEEYRHMEYMRAETLIEKNLKERIERKIAHSEKQLG